MFAPSPYTSPPASWTMRQISAMFGLNRPSVLGSVIMSPARSGVAARRSASRSSSPRAVDGTSTTSYPAIDADAGLVPCALSGMRMTLRWSSPRDRWYDCVMSTPASSPCAPASVARLQPASPVISQR